ncbi:contractile injection system protein, VgrG/Pvc8 family [Archangium sp.]|uniref:contractile injection system protein, VgrG/Pvc8 family n=1 Tax=Archangium sp. TaxID=1872627 RepID=UPI002D62A403|nr:contractile injection system protein, VgrG/Pvc8 family [Archangium sp.]HYO54527.1 contractile injection system protein, VgrG/Pvc8 family [Archangium sp.]
MTLSLSGYEAREYCTQCRETDFAFVSRLMEWEGLFYFFQHTQEGTCWRWATSPER